jgi:hypothetical protein
MSRLLLALAAGRAQTQTGGPMVNHAAQQQVACQSKSY